MCAQEVLEFLKDDIITESHHTSSFKSGTARFVSWNEIICKFRVALGSPGNPEIVLEFLFVLKNILDLEKKFSVLGNYGI